MTSNVVESLHQVIHLSVLKILVELASAELATGD
jgi:hypothetical protein